MSAGRAGAVRFVALGAVVMAVLSIGCDDSVVGTDTYSPEPCVLPSTSVPASAVEGLDRADVRVAVLDAAERMTATLPAGGAVDELRTALASLTGELDPADADTGCRILNAARAALDAQDDAPATRPDLAALRLVLEMATAVLGASAS